MVNEQSEISYTHLSLEIDENSCIEVYREKGPLSILNILTACKDDNIFNLANDLLLRKMKINSHTKETLLNLYILGGNKGELNLSVTDCIKQWKLPLYFFNYHGLCDMLAQDEFGMFNPIPWQWSCHKINKNYEQVDFNQWLCLEKQATENDFKESLSQLLNESGTIIVWGNEKLEYLSGIVENTFPVIDMQVYTHGYFLREQANGRLPFEFNMPEEWADVFSSKKLPLSVQPLFGALNDETMLQYIYADLQYGHLTNRQIIVDKLTEYLALNTLAMFSLYRVWGKQTE